MKRPAFIIMFAVVVIVWNMVTSSAVFAQTMSRQTISGKEYRTSTWSAEAAQEPQTGSQHNA
jgi:hypothetical protein